MLSDIYVDIYIFVYMLIGVWRQQWRMTTVAYDFRDLTVSSCMYSLIFCPSGALTSRVCIGISVVR
jgi:hypothetical protein